MRASGAHALSRVGREGCPKISCVSCSHGCENWTIKKAAAKSLQSCPTLCGPIDGRPPGSPIPGILQARTLEWVAISFSNARKGKGKVKSFSCVRPSVTPLTAAYQAPPVYGIFQARVLEWGAIAFSLTLLYNVKYAAPFKNLQ